MTKTTVRIDTSKFETSHMRKPRGIGNWGFQFNGDVYWISTSYTNAVKEITRVIKRDFPTIGNVYVVVCP